MTAPIAQHEETTAREPLPPVERAIAADASHAHAPQSPIHPTDEVMNEAKNRPGDPQPGHLAKSVAHWVHKHPQAHKQGAGFWGYQFLRSAAASVPYGISMALVLAGFTKMERTGAALATKESASALTKGFGRTLNGFAAFPAARMSALIGASFTFYRGTSKLGKWMTEYLFNPKDSEQRTAEKVDDLPQEAWRKIKEIAPAESASTPISAIVLGFIVTAFKKPDAIVGSALDWTRDNFKAQPNWGAKAKLLKDVIVKPETKFIKQAAINSFGYALFFELGDRLFKDVQIRRGVWPGEHNSIKALKAAPDEYEQGIKDGNEASNQPKYADSALEAVKEKHHYSFFTSEPNLGRFVFRRLLPTAVGITAYTAVKMRWACMGFNDFSYKAGESLIRKIPKLALGEGAATSLFFLIPVVSEPWEKLYDHFWDAKEKRAQAKEHRREEAKVLTPLQEQKYDELLARVNAKEHAANEGKFAQRA